MLKLNHEAGFNAALLGMALSYWDGAEPLETWWDAERVTKASKRAGLLAHKQGGHNKFLETMQVWFTVKASRTFWQEFDTYRVGTTKQSASTMHTLKKRELTKDDFTPETAAGAIAVFNTIRNATNDITTLKSNLPEGFLQTRVVSTNYKVLQNIVAQREKHRLTEWRVFCEELLKVVAYPTFIKEST